jgi:hypothetical protein
MVPDLMYCRYNSKEGRGLIIQESGDRTQLLVYKLEPDSPKAAAGVAQGLIWAAVVEYNCEVRRTRGGFCVVDCSKNECFEVLQLKRFLPYVVTTSSP